jgi:signal transduction histidine kinase
MNNFKNGVIENQINLEEILALMPGHVYWKDINCVLQGCNDEQARDIGLRSRKEVVGLTAYDTLPKDIADEITRIDKEVMDTGEPKLAEEYLTLPDGKKSIWLSRKIPLYDNNQNVCGILGISIDITEKKRKDDELAEIKHKLAGMTLVGATIAHELRTPLLTINLSAQNIKNYLPDLISTYKKAAEENLQTKIIRKSQLELLSSTCEDIISETEASNLIINVLLTNLDQQNIDTKAFKKCSIVKCVEESIKRYPFQVDEKEFIKWNNKTDFSFLGDELLTVHILFNLLKNAIYYIRAAHKGDIHINLELGEKYNKLYFRDTGSGISPDILPKIFDLFFTKTYHGYGVGLAFCKMVMEIYKGKIECRSIEGKYSEFILSFPKIN